ncbi:rna interference and silencing [Pyrenophora seminiperda CCB06]|uniref:Rna interference and silencing n=1 Tax=Pyrenophora seminiperda CCB06 TaxID=1302712 RepID=A0A3M7MK80_9PLEO|nr:rna interference and silencing [Pyrenophora seminiperda CCB06]
MLDVLFKTYTQITIIMTGRGRGRGRGSRSVEVFSYGKPANKPNQEVTKNESAMVKNSLATRFAATSLDPVLARRPGYGAIGTPIILYANYFQLKVVNGDTDLYRYSLDFSGRDLSRPIIKRLVELLLQTPPFKTLAIGTDWQQKLFSAKKIPLEESSAWDTLTDSRTRNTYKVSVKELGTVSLGQLSKDLRQSTSTYSLKLETIDSLNVVLAYGPSSEANITTAARNKFFPFSDHPKTQMADLGHALQAHRGYFASVRTGVHRIMFNVNVTTSAFHKPGDLLEMMEEYMGVSQTWEDKEVYERLAAFFKYVKFECNYLLDESTNNDKGKRERRIKVHTIVGFAPFKKNSTNMKFRKQDAEGRVTTPTVEEYFKQAHKITLSRPKAPLVNFGEPEDPRWIPAELCRILPGQLARDTLLPVQTREMIRFAARSPCQNAKSITSDGVEIMKIHSLMGLGIEVDPTMITVEGRILPAPALTYRKQTTCTPNNGAWNLDPKKLGDRPFYIAKPLGPWRILVINFGKRETIAGGIDGLKMVQEQFTKVLIQYGMQSGLSGQLEESCVVSLQPDLFRNNKTKEIREQMLAACQKRFLHKTSSDKPPFLFVLLPNDNAVLYDSIKLLFDYNLGIPNVCCIGSKFTTLGAQYFANVAMKVNQKLGGVNHKVALGNLVPLTAMTIVFGIDVTHPSPKSSQTAPSIAGVVASVDADFSQYPGSMRTQARRVEMVEELEEMVVERLRLWQKRNGPNRLPNKVIVYRDGVSEGDYDNVINKECGAFKRAFDQLYGAGKQPPITFIIVGKRHHTRFYPTQVGDTDGKTGNAKAGTIVDRGVTGAHLFDFFLIAHQGLVGTSRPAHYVVLKDENKIGADAMQKLTYNLCYTFARATRSVSLCPPVYYADLLCERGRAYLHDVLKGGGGEFTQMSWHRDVHQALVETMYYL